MLRYMNINDKNGILVCLFCVFIKKHHLKNKYFSIINNLLDLKYLAKYYSVIDDQYLIKHVIILLPCQQIFLPVLVG